MMNNQRSKQPQLQALRLLCQILAICVISGLSTVVNAAITNAAQIEASNTPTVNVSVCTASTANSNSIGTIANTATIQASNTADEFVASCVDIIASCAANETAVLNRATLSSSNSDAASATNTVCVSPNLNVVKTLSSGGPTAEPGETLTYSIAITNNGTSSISLAAGDVQETVPANTTHAGSDDFTCAATAAGSACSNTSVVNIAAAATATLAFSVIVDDPIPAGVTSIDNSVTVPGVDCTAAGQDCDETTPAPTPGNVTGTVWLDVDGDGVNDNGEPGIATVTVYVCASGVTPCNSANSIATAVTDANGDYNFPGLPPGDYQVQVNPDELNPGNELDGLQESPGNIAGNSGTITLPEGGTTQAGFGYLPDPGTGVVEGTVWSDEDGDGVQDPGEIGIPGTTVNLCPASDPTCLASTPITTTTGPDGSYIITGVNSGDYVAFVDPADSVLAAACTPDSVTDCATTPVVSPPFTVEPDGVLSDIDFGFDPDSTLTHTDTIFNDLDGDGQPDAGEPGVGGVTIDLLDSNGNVIATTTTDANGDFSFGGLVDGDQYTIEVTDNAGVLSAFIETTNGVTESTGGMATFTATDVSGDGLIDTIGDDGSATFGYNQPGSISGSVFSDADSSGSFETDESGIALDSVGNPIVIELQDGVCTPGADCPTTTVNADGSYQFTGIAPGSYDAVITNPPAGTATTLETIPVTVSTDGSVSDVNFGYNNTGLSDISGTIFEDLDSDGTNEPNGTDGSAATTQDNEPGIGGVTVDLIDCGSGTCFDGDETVVASTISNPTDGSYSFGDVPDGNYLVAVTDVANVLDGQDLTSGLDQLPVTVDTASGDVAEVDFGYVDQAQTGSVTSGLWMDEDGDGVRDPDELPISGVEVVLHDCGADAVCGNADDGPDRTATTDADGNVIFDELPAGNYQLDPNESDPDFPAGMMETNYSGSTPGGVIPLTEGSQIDEEFGYVPDADVVLLTGTVWSDSNSDGLNQDSEVGLGGVPVIIQYDSNGDGVVDTNDTPITATTNPDGTWSAAVTPNSAAGTLSDYYVRYDSTGIPSELDSSEPTNTGDQDGDGLNDAQYVLTGLNPGDQTNDLDFGFAADTNSATQAGSIAGNVYVDVNGDGDNESGADPAMELVTVNLLDSSGSIIATVITDENGNYTFDGVLPGDYTVVIGDTNDATIGLNPTEVMGGLTTVTIAPDGTAPTDVNFGYAPQQDTTIGLASIGNLIWLDDASTDDGIFNPQQGDVGLAGVTVQCWHDTDGDGVFRLNGIDNLVREVKTDENGEYYCESLPGNSTYFIRITDTDGVLVGLVDAADKSTGRTGNANDPDNENAQSIAGMLEVALPTDNCDTDMRGCTAAQLIDDEVPANMYYMVHTSSPNYTADFAAKASIVVTGTVYDEGAPGDPDNNGTFDGADLPVAGLVVTVTYTLPSGTTVSLTDTTDANGGYSIAVPAGVAFVVSVDPSGTTVDGHSGTENPSGSVSFPAQNIGAVPQVSFGFEEPPTVTNPITLGYFHAEQGVNAGEILIRWQTVTESGNVGFNLYGKARGSDWQKLNPDLIVSPVGDSIEVQEYEYLSVGPVVTRFALGDVDMFGKETIRGPFKLGKRQGANRADRKKTNWAKIRQQSEAKKAKRKAKREAKRAKRIERRLERKLDRQERKMRKKLKRKQRLQDKALKSTSTSQSLNESKPSDWTSRLIGAMLLTLVPSAQASEVTEPVTDPGLIYFKTSEAGIYRVTYEQLLAQGIDLTGVKHWRLALMHRGERVAVRSKGQTHPEREQRWYFGPGGWIEFVAEESTSLYTDQSVYALYEDFYKRKSMRYDVTNPNRIAAPVTTSYKATVKSDYELRYSPAASVPDPWYATRLVSTSQPVTHNLPLELDHILPGPVSVEAAVWGGFVGNHQVSVQLNDYAVGAASFSGFTARTIGGQTTTAALVEGLNFVKVTVTNSEGQVADVVHTDEWSVSYPRRLAVNSDAEQLIFRSQAPRLQVQGYKKFQPGALNRRVYRKRANGEMESLSKVWMPLYADGKYRLRFAGDGLEESTYYVSLVKGLKQVEFMDPVQQPDLLSGNGQYLVISHPDFIDEHMAELIAVRQSEGYSTKVVNVEAVYSAFDHGHFGAQAIDRYIRWAHANLGTEMVLLVGADTHDYHDYKNTGSMSFMPSLYVQTSDRIYHAPSDAKYADVDGDDIPDVAIGRMIPRTTQEWANSVTKTLQYASHPNPNSIVFAVDEADSAGQYSFSADADETIAELPDAWQGNITRAYIDELGIAGARSMLLDALNDGQAVAGMFGHSGARDWTFSGLFKADDAGSLTNAGSPTVITQWGCWNTYYVAATEDTLAHEFLLNDLNGAAAVLGASTLTQADHERELAKQVYPRMFEAGKPVGQAVLEAKRAHALTYSDELDVILGWNLLGDPALQVEQGE